MTDESTETSLIDKAKSLVAWVMKLKAVRVALHYTSRRGPILASGLAYQALFAGFAALWVGFSIAGIVLSGNLGLRNRIVSFLADAVPGLITTDSNEGVIDPDTLLSAGGLSFAAVISLGILLFTALGWLDSARASVRTLFELPQHRSNFAKLKLIDLGVGAAFGVALVLSVALSVASTQATGWLLDIIGLSDSIVATIASRAASFAVMFALNVLVLVALYRFLSGIPIPWSRLRYGVIVVALGLNALQLLGSALISGVSRNPLIAPFAVIAGLLLWFNFSCQVILLGASWIAVDVDDRGIVLDPQAFEHRLEEARALVAAHPLPEDEQEKPSLLDRILRRGP
jgi:membrane protein